MSHRHLGNEIFDTDFAMCDGLSDMINHFDNHKDLMDFLTSKDELPTAYSSHKSVTENICNYERIGNILTG